jgi:hypothetical protein
MKLLVLVVGEETSRSNLPVQAPTKYELVRET